jgi:hypothetical protein
MAAKWASVPPIIPAPMSAIFFRAIELLLSSVFMGGTGGRPPGLAAL